MGIMLGEIGELFSNTIKYILFYYMLTRQLNSNKNGIFRIFGIIILVFICNLFYRLQISSSATLLIILILDVFYTVTMFNGSIITKIIWGCTPSIVGILGNFFAFTLAGLFMSFGLNEALEISGTRTILTIIYLLICAIIYYILAHFKNHDNYLPLHFRFILLLMLILGIAATDQLINIAILIHSANNYSGFVSVVFIAITLLLILITSIFLFERLGYITSKNTELSTKLKQYKIEKDHVETITQTMDTIRDLKHDMKQYKQTIQGFIANKDYVSLDKYLNSLNPVNFSILDFSTTGFPTIDAILTNKLMIARANDIKIEYETRLTQDLPINDVDLSIILGNVLDNAMEACYKIKDKESKWVNLSIQRYKDMLNIKIINSSDGIYRFKNNRLISTKKEPNHGIGCKRIEELAVKFQGFCVFEANKNIFTTSINIPYTSEYTI